MVEFKYPNEIFPGDEIVCETLKIGPINNKTRVTFHWGDAYIQVVGANMIAPNIFEFEPCNEQVTWFLKYCVSQNAKPSSKSVYLTIETIKTNKVIIWLARILATVLFVIPLLLYIDRASGINLLGNSFNLQMSFGAYAITLPLSMIVFVALWTSKVTAFIDRLSSIREEIKVDYEGKGVSLKSVEIKPRPKVDADNNQNLRYHDNIRLSNWESIWRTNR